MAHLIGSRIKEQASSSGLADFTVIGALAGFKTFASKLPANGDTTWYCAVNGDEWEEGLMTRTSASVYARTQVMESSNGNAKVNFSAAPVVYCTIPASQVNVVGNAGFGAVSTVTQTVGAGGTKVVFGLEDFDLGGAFDLPNSRFIAPINGTYQFTAAVAFSVPPTGSPLITLFKNGVAAMHIDNAPANSSRVNSVGSLQLTAGDVVELYVNTNAVSAGTISNGSRFQGFLVPATGITLAPPNTREALLAARTYYVRTDGSDTNNGLTNSAAGAFLTLQKASDTITKLDLNGFDVTVQVADGTYTAPVKMPVLTGKGDCTFLGNTATPANVIVSVTSSDAFSADKPGSYHVNGFKLQTTTSGACIAASKGAVIRFSNVNFGACAGAHIYANGGIVSAQTNYTISGGAAYHVGGQDLGNVDTNNRTVTLTGTPAFSVAFVYMRNCSVFSPFGCTFSGAATGPRYILANNATCFVNGAATTFLPGNAAGSLTNGASYG